MLHGVVCVVFFSTSSCPLFSSLLFSVVCCLGLCWLLVVWMSDLQKGGKTTHKSPSNITMAATMRKFGRQLGAAKINVLEKMGKRESTETEEMANENRVTTRDILFSHKRKWKKYAATSRTSTRR